MKKQLIFAMAISVLGCGEAAQTQLIDPNNEISEERILDMPKGIHWREEIEVFEFSAEDALNWNYDREGVVLMPESFASKVEGMKSGDVLIAWDGFMFFVKDVSTTNEGIAISVKRFNLSDAIYGDFNVPLNVAEEETGIGNLEVGHITLSVEDFGGVPGTFELDIQGSVKSTLQTNSVFQGRIPKVNRGYECESGRYCVDEMSVILNFDVETDLKAKVTYSNEFDYVKNGDRRLGVINKVRLGQTGLALVAEIIVPLEVKLTLKGEGSFGFESSSKSQIPLGFEYIRPGFNPDRGEGFSLVPNANHRFESESNIQGEVGNEVTWNLEAQAKIHAHAGLGLAFSIVPVVSSDVGIEGIRFTGTLNADLVANPFDDEEKCLKAGLTFKLAASAQLKFFIDSWIGDWQWDLTPPIEENIIEPIKIGEEFVDSTICVERKEVNMIRITQVREAPTGLHDPEGYELDSVSILRYTDGHVHNATEATGGTNAEAALGDGDTLICEDLDSKVALVTSPIVLTFDEVLNVGDIVFIQQYNALISREIGVMGACDTSGTVRVEIGDGESWNIIIAGLAKNGNYLLTEADFVFD